MIGRRRILFTGNFEEAINCLAVEAHSLLSGACDAWQGVVPSYTINDIAYLRVGATISVTVG